MCFFNRFVDTINFYYIDMAKDLLSNFGHEESTYNANLGKGGGYYKDIVYKNYGLTIVQPDLSRYHYKRDRNYEKHHNIYIKYYGDLVLDKQIYNQGPWEEVLIELHKKIPAILEEQKRQSQLYEKYREIVSVLGSIRGLSGKSVVHIGNGIITSFDDDEDDYCRVTWISYEVTYNNQTVFKANYSMNEKKIFCYVYTPGQWEDELYRYLEQLKINRQHQKERWVNERARESLNKLKNL